MRWRSPRPAERGRHLHAGRPSPPAVRRWWWRAARRGRDRARGPRGAPGAASRCRPTRPPSRARAAGRPPAAATPPRREAAAGRARLQRVSELLAELGGELLVVEALVLRARVLDLQRAHQVADAPDGLPVVPLLDAEDQPGTERVAAAGGVGDPGLVRRRDVVGPAVGIDHHALGAAGGDVGLDLAGDRRLVPAGAL